eukprot:GHVR01019183.1.p2 GENE.GHVR01019183.1~~GHVR01019183.1.p2  ORF type:complete len:158 (-),score=63.31 GHVR01019183.1:1820-2293(-)
MWVCCMDKDYSVCDYNIGSIYINNIKERFNTLINQSYNKATHTYDFVPRIKIIIHTHTHTHTHTNTYINKTDIDTKSYSSDRVSEGNDGGVTVGGTKDIFSRNIYSDDIIYSGVSNLEGNNFCNTNICNLMTHTDKDTHRRTHTHKNTHMTTIWCGI